VSTDEPTPTFATLAMAEILLGQELLAEAREVLAEVARVSPDEPRLAALGLRCDELARQSGELVGIALEGRDRVLLSLVDGTLAVEWEATAAGLELARRVARYSGQTTVRIFSAALGPRGVRCTVKDVPARRDAGRIRLAGLARPAVHVAAVGFLAHSGRFVPLAGSGPCEIRS